MLKKSSIFAGMLVLLICSLIIAGTSISAETLPDLIVAVHADAQIFDPALTIATVTEMFTKNIYSNLVAFNKKLEIIPDLAESWELSKDGLTWTFHLCQNVKFHDGTPFNAEAVKITLDRVIDPDTGAPSRSNITNISNVEIVDDNTIKITTSAPCVNLLNKLAHPGLGIVSPTALEKYGKDLGSNPSGTGPFVFKEWNVGSEIILERNPDYFGDLPKINKLIFRVVPEAATRTLLLESGAVDVALNIPGTDVERLRAKEGIVVDLEDTIMTNYLGAVLCSSKYLGDVRVRQALNYATDKEGIINNLVNGMATVAVSPTSPYVWGHAYCGVYEYNPEKAKELLAEAGCPDGFDVEINASKGRYLMGEQVVEMIQSQWKEIGVNATIRLWDHNALTAQLGKGECDIQLALRGWSPSTAEADSALHRVFHTSNYPVSNSTGLNNPEVDKLLDDAKVEPDPERAKELYAQAQQIIWNQAPWIYLYYTKEALAYRNNISNLEFLATGHILFQTVVKK